MVPYDLPESDNKTWDLDASMAKCDKCDDREGRRQTQHKSPAYNTSFRSRRLIRHAQKYGLIHPCQHGSVSGRTTYDPIMLTQVTNDLCCTLKHNLAPNDELPSDTRQQDQVCAHPRSFGTSRSRSRNPRSGATQQCTIENFFPSARPPDTLPQCPENRPQDSLTQIPRANTR